MPCSMVFSAAATLSMSMLEGSYFSSMLRLIRVKNCSYPSARSVLRALFTYRPSSETLVAARMTRQPQGASCDVRMLAASWKKTLHVLLYILADCHPFPSVVPEDRLVVVDRFHKQLGLVAERGIKARRIDAHRRTQLQNRRGLVATSPEDAECALQRCLTIKGSRAASAFMGRDGQLAAHGVRTFLPRMVRRDLTVCIDHYRYGSVTVDTKSITELVSECNARSATRF